MKIGQLRLNKNYPNSNHKIYLAFCENKIYAYTLRSPYFCFIGEKQDDLLKKIYRALDFYYASIKNHA